MSIKFIGCVCSSFTLGVVVGIYLNKCLRKNVYEIPKTDNSSNEQDKKKFEDVATLNLFNEQHKKNSEGAANDGLFFFGPKKNDEKEMLHELNSMKVSGRLSSQEEANIMMEFQNIKGMRVRAAQKFVEEKDYKLWCVYINGEKYPSNVYNPTLIGVSVKDSSYNENTGIVSNYAIIKSIVDVGGQDIQNRVKN